MRIPSRKKCFELLKKYKMPERMLRHTLVVNRVSNFLAERLKSAGEEIDEELVDRASLLHDIAKSKCLKEGCDHDTEGYKILKNEGLEGIAVIVRKHVWGELKTWEEKIIFYADKRVKHDKTVTLEERMSDLKERYHGDKLLKKIINGEKLAHQIEKEIFEKIGGFPDDSFS